MMQSMFLTFFVCSCTVLMVANECVRAHAVSAKFKVAFEFSFFQPDFKKRDYISHGMHLAYVRVESKYREIE